MGTTNFWNLRSLWAARIILQRQAAGRWVFVRLSALSYPWKPKE
jgi:hypothetical protein